MDGWVGVVKTGLVEMKMLILISPGGATLDEAYHYVSLVVVDLSRSGCRLAK